MQQGDYASSYYQYTMPNPNPNPNQNDACYNSTPSTHASAPPILSSNFPNNYSFSYPQYTLNPDHVSDLPPAYSPNNHFSQPYSFPHLPSPQQTQYYPYDQNTNSSVPATSYSSGYGQFGSRYENSCESNENFGEFGGYGSSKLPSFDDYGRPITLSSGKDEGGRQSKESEEVVKAVPQTSTLQEIMSGVQKFRVMLLSESGGQSNMDVLCQIGLDGIRMLDPGSGRILRIYPLETVTRWEVLDSAIFAFWSKSSIDIEPRRIRLKSNSYTSNTILDAVTVATIQFKEMGADSKTSDIFKASEQLAEKKKGLTEWMKLMKAKSEEKDHWVPDEAVTMCTACDTDFGAFIRKHHCRNCGDIFCDKCTQGRIALTADEEAQSVRVCDRCLAEVTERLSNSFDPPGKVSKLQSHEDLAKKLQEETDRKRQASSGFKTDESSVQMQDVACPTCTVNLKVQAPISGSKTIECSVCLHPFLVNAN